MSYGQNPNLGVVYQSVPTYPHQATPEEITYHPHHVIPPATTQNWESDSRNNERIYSNEKDNAGVGMIQPVGGKSPSRSLNGKIDISFMWMFLWFILGFVLCVLHHVFNLSREGKVVEGDLESFRSLQNQRVVIFIGTAFAFTTKACYAFSLDYAYQQVVWRIWNNRPTTAESMHDVISLPGDATRFFRAQLWRYAKRPLFIGIIIWLSFFGTVFAPSTISVELNTITTYSNKSVPTLDFLAVENARPHGYKQLYLTGPTPGTTATTYGSISPEMDKLRMLTSYGGSIIPGPGSPCGQNCTYTITFPGPAQKCDYISNYTLEADNPWKANATTNSTTTPVGNRVYEGTYGLISYYDATIGESKKENTGAEDLWISWAYRKDPEDQIPELDTFELPRESGDSWQLRTVRCIDYNATYTVDVSYVNGVQQLKPSLTYLHKTKYNYDSTNMSILTNRTSTVVDPGGLYLHRAVKDALISTLGGSLYMAGGASTRSPVLSSEITNTILVRPYIVPGGSRVHGLTGVAYLAIPDLGRGIEELAVNLTLTLLGTENLVYRDSQGAVALVSESRDRNVFDYKPRNLILSYALLTGLTAIAVVMGMTAASNNGFWGNTTFATMYVMTRRKELATDETNDGLADGVHVLKRSLKVERDFTGKAYFTDAGRQ